MSYEDTSDEAIARRIEELSELPTFPPFCYGFYRLVAAYVAELSVAGSRLRGVFVHFLMLELWYHRELERMVQRDKLTVGDLQSVTDKRRVNLGALAETVSERVSGDGDERVRHLLLAECFYHLRQTEKVVAHLENAVQAGAEDSVVQFALGYNRFALALEAFVRRGSNPDEWLVRDYPGFQKACLNAVSAFEMALRGQSSDLDLYNWIARVLHIAGFSEAAEHAQEQAREAHESADRDEDDEPEWRSGGYAVPGSLPPISPDEVDTVGELLKGSFRVHDLLQDDGDR